MQYERIHREIVETLQRRYGAATVGISHDHPDPLTATFRVYWRYSGRSAKFVLTDSEAQEHHFNGWMEVVCAEADAFCVENQRARRAISISQPPIMRDGIDAMSYGMLANATTNILANPPRTLTSGEIVRGMAYLRGKSPKRAAEREKSEARAKALFEQVAGKPALAAVQEAGLHMTGSAGTAYVLHAKMAYCVTRVKDKAKMCAVVPGVPMYDHLLGIKMMVEHDEPEFVRTANVSQGYDYGLGISINCVWLDEAQTIQSSRVEPRHFWGIDLAQP